MTWYQIAHLAVNLSLVIAVTLFLALWWTGLIEVRRPVSAKDGSDRAFPVAEPKARLVVLRGLRPNWEYRIFEGTSIIGRADQQPVDIDLQPQEPEDRVWSSRQHAAIMCARCSLTIEDLKTANGTYVNSKIVPPGTKRALKTGDVIQIGEVQLKVLE